MRARARRFYGSFLVVAFLTSASAVVAQELQLDTKSLDTTGGSSVQVKRKGKKGADAAAPQPAGKGGPQGGPNRQFGELEGWSPGKAPPKTKEQLQQEEQQASPTKGGGVSMTPSGNVGVGLPF